MKNAFLVLSLIFHSAIANGQWGQTNGPTGGWSTDIFRLSGNLFVNGSNGGDGGIFRSTDDGETWTAVNNGLPRNTCYALTYSGTNLFAAIYEHGIYKSSDLGANWTPVGLDGKTCYALLVAGHDIYAGWSEGGIYYSGDDGKTWTLRNTGQASDQVRDFVVLNDTLFVEYPNSGAYESLDKGATLSRLNIDEHLNVFTGSGTSLYGVTTGINISKDFGKNWLPSLPGETATALYADGDNIAAADYFKFYTSIDNGDGWTIHDNPSYSGRISSVYSENNKVYVAGGHGVHISPDHGATWAPKNSGLRNNIITHLVLSGTNIFAGTGKGIFTSPDNGETWTSINNGLVDNTGSNYIVGVEINGIHRGPTKMFTATTRGVYSSTDNGGLWTSKLGVAGNTLITMSGSKGKLFVHTGDNQYYSTNEGDNWTTRSETLIKNYGGRSLLKGDTVVLMIADKVFLSKNFGETWKELPAMPSVFTTTQALFIDNKLLVSTYQGVFEYSFTENTWTKRPQGLTTDQVVSLTYVKGIVYAGTNNGVFLSLDRGLTWIPTGTTNRQFDVLAANDTYMFGGTYGESVWKIKMTDLDLVTGVDGPEEIAADKGIKIYPNPASQKLYVNVPHTREYRVKDVMGREILRGVFAEGKNENVIDISVLTSGTYFVEVYAAAKTVHKFIKTGY